MSLICIIITISVVSNACGYWEGDPDWLSTSIADLDSTNTKDAVDELKHTMDELKDNILDHHRRSIAEDMEYQGPRMSRALLALQSKIKGEEESLDRAVDPLIVPLAFVVDHEAFQKFDQNASRINDFCAELVNHMNSHFSKLYVKVMLADVLIWYEKDAFDISSDRSRTMKHFGEYNRNILLPKSKHTHAQLITGQVLLDAKDDKVMDHAPLNTICTDESSSVVMLADTSNVKLQALFSTHELAHSLNIKHTTSKCKTCIMAPNAYENPEDRHDWTVGNIKDFTNIIEEKQCLFMGQTDVNIYKPNTCGNGDLEPDEDCDIGQRDLHNASCCDAWTCQFALDQGDVKLLKNVLVETIRRIRSKDDSGGESQRFVRSISSPCEQRSPSQLTKPPEKPMNVSLVLVVDHTAYQNFDRDINRINNFCIDLVNLMNFHLLQLFLQVVLIDVVIWYDKDSIEINHDAVKSMNDFEDYNKKVLLNISKHHHAQLITGKQQLDENNRLNLGRARLNTICTADSSSVVMLHDMSRIELQAVTNAHELAHAFNMKHTDSNCSECIMAPNAGTTLTAAGNWTAGNLADFIRTVRARDCLFTEQAEVFVPNSCGNGVMDIGEECDIGQRDKGDTKCCIAWTCRHPANSNDWQDEDCNQEKYHDDILLNIVNCIFLGLLIVIIAFLLIISVNCSNSHSFVIKKVFQKLIICFKGANKFESKMPVPSSDKENTVVDVVGFPLI